MNLVLSMNTVILMMNIEGIHAKIMLFSHRALRGRTYLGSRHRTRRGESRSTLCTWQCVTPPHRSNRNQEVQRSSRSCVSTAARVPRALLRRRVLHRRTLTTQQSRRSSSVSLLATRRVTAQRPKSGGCKVCDRFCDDYRVLTGP